MCSLASDLGQTFRLYWETSVMTEMGWKRFSEDIKNIQGLSLWIFQHSEAFGEIKKETSNKNEKCVQ